MNKIKVGVVIPDRGDRPEFLDNCLRMIKAQTRQPDVIELVNYPAVSDICDITPRYKLGYKNASAKGVDVILLMENDDWYHPKYIEIMLQQWEENGRPPVLGHQYTIYFHIGLRRYMIFHHMHRSSAMNTLVIAGQEFNWGPDDNPYFDSWLWHNVCKEKRWRKVNIVPPFIICLGIKHNTGKVGGSFHDRGLPRYITADTSPPALLSKSVGPAWDLYTKYRMAPDATPFLREVMDAQSFDFYTGSIQERLQIKKVGNTY